MKKTFFITTIVIMLMSILALSGFLIWYYLPINQINRAFDDADYEKVASLYEYIKKDEDRASIQDKFIEITKDYYNNYLCEIIQYDEINEYYDLVEDVMTKNKSFSRYKDDTVEIYDSRNAYNRAKELMDNKVYIDAINDFNLVSDKDKKYKKLAVENSAICRNSYCTDVIFNAQTLMDEHEYLSAKEVVTEALEYFPEESTLQDMLANIDAFLNIDINGKWCAIYNFGQVISGELGINAANLNFPVKIVMQIDNNSSGNNIKVYMDSDSIKNAIDVLTSDEASMKAIFELANQYGLDKNLINIAVTTMYGGSYSKFVYDYFGSEIEKVLNEYSYTNKCDITPDKIAFSQDETIEYEYNNSSLVLKSYIGNNDLLNIIQYPLTLVRE